MGLSSSSSVVLIGRAYQNFVNSLASPESRLQYVYILKKYMEFVEINDVDQLIKQDPKIIEQQIIDYIISLRDLARATKSLRMASNSFPLFHKRCNPEQEKVRQVSGAKATAR